MQKPADKTVVCWVNSSFFGKILAGDGDGDRMFPELFNVKTIKKLLGANRNRDHRVADRIETQNNNGMGNIAYLASHAEKGRIDQL